MICSFSNTISKYLPFDRKQSVKKHSVVFLWVQLSCAKFSKMVSVERHLYHKVFLLILIPLSWGKTVSVSGDSFPALMGTEVTVTLTHAHTQPIKAKHVGKNLGLWQYDMYKSSFLTTETFHLSCQCWWREVRLAKNASQLQIHTNAKKIYTTTCHRKYSEYKNWTEKHPKCWV